MRKSWRLYAAASAVFIVSFVIAWIFPTTESFRGIFALPGVGALLVALFQVFRDQTAHEKSLELQNKQQFFNLGVASHMANVVFDKHILFSEQYIAKMQECLSDLVVTGPPGNSLKFSSELIDIRLSFRAWITEDLYVKLSPFENALTEIGAKKFALEGLPPGEKRKREVQVMFDLFSNVLGYNSEGPVCEEITPGKIISHLQDLLGVRQMNRLRSAVINEAINCLEGRT